jgi:hypothetical protein
MTFLTIITSAAPNIAGIFDALHEKVRARAPDVADQVPHTMGWCLLVVSLTIIELPIAWAGLWDDVRATLAPLDGSHSSLKTPCVLRLVIGSFSPNQLETIRGHPATN